MSILFIDIDGTLIDYEGKTPASAKEAVNKARQNGHKVYLCTGCSKAEIQARDLPETDGLIGGNGAYVESHGDILFHNRLSQEQVKDIVDWCMENGNGFYLECNSGMYADSVMLEKGLEIMEIYSARKGKGPEMAQSFLHLMIPVQGESAYRDDVNKISFILNDYSDHEKSKEKFPDLEANTWGGAGETALFGDLGPHGVTKQSSIQLVLNHEGEKAEDAIAFGDAKIDLSMFDICGTGVAMGNGGPEIKEAADWITDDVNADGLYKAFEHLGLLND